MSTSEIPNHGPQRRQLDQWGIAAPDCQLFGWGHRPSNIKLIALLLLAAVVIGALLLLASPAPAVLAAIAVPLIVLVMIATHYGSASAVTVVTVNDRTVDVFRAPPQLSGEPAARLASVPREAVSLRLAGSTLAPEGRVLVLDSDQITAPTKIAGITLRNPDGQRASDAELAAAGIHR